MVSVPVFPGQASPRSAQRAARLAELGDMPISEIGGIYMDSMPQALAGRRLRSASFVQQSARRRGLGTSR